MGVGEGFDDELLSELARRGKGGYYYLANPEAIPAAFGRELAGVFAIAATGVELRIIPEAEVSSFEVVHRLVTRATVDGLCVEIGEIANHSPRQVLVRMVRANLGPQNTKKPLLAKLAVTYKDANGNPGGSHLDRLAMPETASPAEIAEVASGSACAWPPRSPSTKPGRAGRAGIARRPSPRSPTSAPRSWVPETKGWRRLAS